MSGIRLYQLVYPENRKSVCATDDKNLILHPKHRSPHKLVAYAGDNLMDYDDHDAALAVGSQALMMRLSHVESRQLIVPDDKSIATITSLSTIAREEYEKATRDHKERSDERAEKESKIKSVTVRKMTEIRRKCKEEEEKALEELAPVPSLDDLLQSHIPSGEHKKADTEPKLTPQA